MANEWNPGEVFEVLADERARVFLIDTNNQKRSVKDLDRLLVASQSSIYRRVDVIPVRYTLESEERSHGR